MHLTANTVVIDGYDASGDFPSGIFATTGVEGKTPYAQTGAGGSITIDTQDLTVENGAEIQTNSLGQRLDAGAAGAITIQNADAADGMSERVIVRGEPGVVGDGSRGSKIASQGNDGGDGGSLTIKAHAVEFTDGGEASSSTNKEGDSGNVRVIADTLLISGRNANTTSGIFAQTNGGQLGDPQDPSNPGSGNSGSIHLTVNDSTVVTDEGRVSVLTDGGGSAGNILFDGEGSVEVSDGGVISSDARGFIRNPSATSDIIIRGAESLLVTGEGAKITAEASSKTNSNAFGGNIIVEATNIEVSDGGIITAQSLVEETTGGPAGSISLTAGVDLKIHDGGKVTTAVIDGGLPAAADGGAITSAADEVDGSAADEELAGGTIHLSAGENIEIDQNSEVRASSSGSGDAGDILVWGARKFSLESESTMTAETTGTGRGGQIVIEKVGDIFIGGASSVTTKSSEGAGDAGSIAIAAIDTFQMDSKSEITTTADDAGGGRISIQAGKLVSLYDSKLETTVGGVDNVEGDAGDIDITYRGDEPGMTEPQIPEFVVINRSTIRANANRSDAGNISIAGRQVLISSDSIIQATSNEGVSGEIRITSPDTDVVSRVTPLTTAFIDPSDRLLPPCIARTERTGSFIVQNRPATPPSPDSPLAAGLGTAEGASGASPSDSVECSVFEEKI
jgi:large exoprotein involved in heme utilization and adhesion